MTTSVRDSEVIAERMRFTSCREPFRELETEKLLCLEISHVGFATHINTDVKRAHRITFFRKWISGQAAWQYPWSWSINTLAISEFGRRWADANPTAKGTPINSNKQPVGLKLTSMSGEQTFCEVTTEVQQERKELLPDWHRDQLYHGYDQTDWFCFLFIQLSKN